MKGHATELGSELSTLSPQCSRLLQAPCAAHKSWPVFVGLWPVTPTVALTHTQAEQTHTSTVRLI